MRIKTITLCKLLLIPLLILPLLCAACSQGAGEPGTVDPAETAVSDSIGSSVNDADLEQPAATISNPVDTPNKDNAETASTTSDTTPAFPNTTQEPEEQPSSEEAPGQNDTPSATETPGEQEIPSETETSEQQETPKQEEAPKSTESVESSGAVPVPPDGPVVLTIKGDGVDRETTWALNQLQALADGYREIIYSTTNNWPTFGFAEAHGVSLPYLLREAGMKDNAAGFKFTSSDGYNVTVTYDQVFGTYYSYSNHSPSGSSGAFVVEPLLAWEWGDVGKVREEKIRPHFGQSGPMDVNSAYFVKGLVLIEVSTVPAGAWAAPEASIASGAAVPVGTELELIHSDMDNVRIYYTLDGSEPDYNSKVYNPSTSYFQPDLTKPLVLTENVTVKVFAAAYGKNRSPVAVFSYTVE